MSSTECSSSPCVRRGHEASHSPTDPVYDKSFFVPPTLSIDIYAGRDDNKNNLLGLCGRFLMRCVYPFIAVDTLIIVAEEQTSPGFSDDYQNL
jgi:hypothetical protein